ncbi:MAG: cobalamin-binding protein [Mongoliibacter sp.]|nr:helical backbone metal receptor [Mongoliibacter sp.]TVP50349.1 MAG: cobalamin-binding protein [Mongoliibacter sp.]
MPFFTDQMHRTIEISERPQRIISLVPSQTELLVDLGLRERLVGVTKFCVHPKGLKKEKTIIGGTKNFHFDKIDALKPDLIIGNKEENFMEGIEKLSENYPVWMSNIYTLEDALDMMLRIGEITATSSGAEALAQKIHKDFDFLPEKKGSAVYLIWKDPIIAVGSKTFIDDILTRVGFQNLIGKNRYPELSIDELEHLNPEYLLLSSEPYPFKQKHVDEFAYKLSNTKIQLVDGEMFSWYGSRLQHAKAYLQNI